MFILKNNDIFYLLTMSNTKADFLNHKDEGEVGSLKKKIFSWRLYKTEKNLFQLIDRPGVAGAVLQTASLRY